jgi:hypothetical protein
MKTSRSKVRDQQSGAFGFDSDMRLEEPANIHQTILDSGESEVSRGPHVHFQIVREIQVAHVKLQAKPRSLTFRTSRCPDDAGPRLDAGLRDEASAKVDECLP